MTSNKHRVLTSHYENDYSRHDDKNYYFSDDRNYDATRDAMEKFRRNPAKYESESRRETSRQSSNYESPKRSGPVEVVMEHWLVLINWPLSDQVLLKSTRILISIQQSTRGTENTLKGTRPYSGVLLSIFSVPRIL
ncbi:hypothetical protein DPMN_142436 [Dreissena polymorpha]|uniref:Uncharacterized protein n=1 Tax=Dreissena polymorpha TaxID=45954 RepID=A0A9D4GH90_DREPO|nr:hypothetical protein DPMN_142436 [Dreissena polymorpha]